MISYSYNSFIRYTGKRSWVKHALSKKHMTLGLTNKCGVSVKANALIKKIILVNEYKTKGAYEVNFSGNGLASGLYFTKLQAGSTTLIQKMILAK